MAHPPSIYFGALPRHAEGVSVTLDTLLASKLLVQANSGGGKSHAIRYLLEQTHGHVQHIVLDREGEFATLRAKYAYVLAGRDGDVAADVRTAKLLARRMMETGLSLIVDLSEMSLAQQRDYVRAFVDSINHLPRTLWKDCLIVIDEAHLFAPEKGKGSSVASEAIALLLSTGRKRGYCAVLATQRIAKLDKDVAAECLNKLIGRTSQEDVGRAADELAMSKEAGRALRALEPGTFYAYGPAIASDPVLVRTGAVVTEPPKRGAQRAAVPVAPEAIKRALAAELADLPKQAAEEEQTVAQLRRRIAELERAAKAGPARVVEKAVADPRAIDRAVKDALRPQVATISALRRALESAVQFIIKVSTHNFDVAGVDKAALEQAVTAAVGKATQIVEQRLDARAKQIERMREDAKRILATLKTVTEEQEITVAVDVARNEPYTVKAARERLPQPEYVPADGEGRAGGEQRILDALAELELFGITPAERPQVAMMASYASLSGGQPGRLVGRLVEQGLLEIPGPGTLALSDAGRSVARFPNGAPSREALHRHALSKLSDGESRILSYLLDRYPEAVSRADVAAATNYASLSGGQPGRLVGNLVTLRFAEIPSAGMLKAGRILFPEGLG